MGGQMWVDSEEGNGSKFSFTAKFELSPNQEQRRLSVDLESMAVSRLSHPYCKNYRVALKALTYWLWSQISSGAQASTLKLVDGRCTQFTFGR